MRHPNHSAFSEATPNVPVAGDVVRRESRQALVPDRDVAVVTRDRRGAGRGLDGAARLRRAVGVWGWKGRGGSEDGQFVR